MSYRKTIASLVLAGAMLMAASPALSRPMYAARERKPCAFCHINPAGGGPRKITGQFYAKNGHTFPDPMPSMAEIERIMAGGQTGGADAGPVASHESFWDRVTLSSTMVMAHTLTSGDQGHAGDCQSCHAEGNIPHNKVILMSGRVDIAVKVSDDLTFVWSNDLGEMREVYGLYTMAPQAMSVKAGLFVVPFGLKTTDHTTLVKSKFNVGSNKRDVGVAVQGAYGLGFYEAAITRGGNLDAQSPPVRTFGGSDPTISVTGGIRWAGAQLGAAFMKRRGLFIDRYEDTDVVFRTADNPNGYDQLRYDVFGSYTAGIVTVEGEFVYGTDKETRVYTASDGLPQPETFPRVGTYLNLMVTPFRPLNVGARYEFFDPSRDHKYDAITHYILYSTYNITPNLSIQGRYRIRREASSTQITNNDFITLLEIRL